MAAPPGWYDDGSGRQRWWDGERWSNDVIDLREDLPVLRNDAGPANAPAAPAGWHEVDGRQRWWDGRQWTNAYRYSGEEREFEGIVADGRWIHYGELSRPVGQVAASVQPGSNLVGRSKLAKALAARDVVGPSGTIPGRMLRREIRPTIAYVLIDSAEQAWVLPVPAGRDADAQSFVAWVTTLSSHYRYRD